MTVEHSVAREARHEARVRMAGAVDCESVAAELALSEEL